MRRRRVDIRRLPAEIRRVFRRRANLVVAILGDQLAARSSGNDDAERR